MIGQPTGSSTQFEEVDIDFRVSRLLLAFVKQADNSRVRELVKKIENHPHRQSLQRDLQQNNAYNPFRERCIKRNFQGIHHRFVNDPEFRASQLEHDPNEEVCIKMDELAHKDFRRHMTQAEYFRYTKNWWISLNNSGSSGPLRDRSDFNDALSTLHHLHQESGERQLRPVPFWKYQYWHQSSSSSSSWWQRSDSWWSSK